MKYSTLGMCLVVATGCGTDNGDSTAKDVGASQEEGASSSSDGTTNSSAASANDGTVATGDETPILSTRSDNDRAEDPEDVKATVTFGDFQEFPSSEVIHHVLDLSVVGSVMTSESLQLSFSTKDASGHKISFWFDYSEGDLNFSIGENGNLGFDKDGTHWDARAGEVSIVEVDGTMSVTFTGIEMAPFLPDTTHGDPVLWGDGVIVGTVKRTCNDAPIDLGARNGVEQESGPTPVENQLDEAWVAEFCEGAR